MAAINPRFNDEERGQLQQQHGLTMQQVFWLERDLGVILDELGPHVPMDDVRGALRDFGREVDALGKRMRRWSEARRPSPGAEALGLLNIAGSDIGRSKSRPDDGTWPEYVVASELVMLLEQISHSALENEPSIRRVPHRASPRAIAKIVERLNRPNNDSSRHGAAVAPAPTYSDITYSDTSGPSFLGVTTIVFSAVHRALHAHQGRPDAVAASAANSIDAYLKQLPDSARRKRGRPKKA